MLKTASIGLMATNVWLTPFMQIPYNSGGPRDINFLYRPYSVANDFPELNEYPKNIFLQQAQKFSRNRPVIPAYPVVSDAIKTLFEDVGIGRKNVEASAREAVEKINIGINEIQKP
jgi:maltose-binding protein MalE